MRLIDADALNEAMYHEAFETDSDMQKWDSGCWIRYKMFEKAIRNAPTIEAEPKWIPCSERLPEEVGCGEEYPLVIFCTDKRSYVGFYEYYKGGRWWNYTEDGVFVVEGVIAWMPLPEPYKETENEAN